MISFLSVKFLGFMRAKGWIIALLLALVLVNFVTAKMLVKSYKANGEQAEQLAQAAIDNQIWAAAWTSRELEIEKSQERLVKRGQRYEVITKDTTEQYKQVRILNDENNVLDTDLGDAYWLHVNKSVEAGNTTYGMPSN